MTAVDKMRAAAARHSRDFDPRTEMPECARFTGWVREVFGKPAGIRAEENGRQIVWGNPLPAAWRPLVWAEFGRSGPKPENRFKRPTPKTDELPYVPAP